MTVRRSYAAASIVVALILAAIAAVPTAPAALYGTYEHVDGFPTAMISVVFSTGVIGVLLGMFVFGHLSDSTGRKRMLLWALGLFVVGSVACAVAPTLAVLICARALQGLGGGGLMASSTGSARRTREKRCRSSCSVKPWRAATPRMNS